MKPVYFRKSQKLPITEALVSFLLSIVLVAFGTNDGTSSAQAHLSSTAHEPTKAPTSLIPSSATSLHPNAENINVKKGSLLIQSSGGIQCPYGIDTQRDQLVFASDSTTYSQDKIEQMRAYFAANVGPKLLSIPTPPPTLRWVLGGSMASISGSSYQGQPSLCGTMLALTNTGNTPIQIPKVGVQLEERPRENSYQYHLIDVCSLIQCGPGPGGSGSCDVYNASIQLGPGEKNAVFSAVPDVLNPETGADCGILTITPAAQVSLNFYFSLASSVPKNILYSIVPLLVVNTVQGVQTLLLPQLVSTLAYASASQFSCYGLQETTFVLEPSPGVSSDCA